MPVAGSVRLRWRGTTASDSTSARQHHDPRRSPMPVPFAARLISLLALITSSLLHPPAIALAQSTAYQPVVVTDDSGVQTSFAVPPQRIISLNTGHTATVFSLGVGGR